MAAWGGTGSLVSRSTVLILLSVLASSLVSHAAERTMVKPTVCPGQVVSTEHRYMTVAARSVLQCAVQCRQDPSCLSLVFGTNSSTCHLANAFAAPDCSNVIPADPGVKAYEVAVVCPYGEERNATGVCVCAEGYRGTPCAPYIGDCVDGYERGNFSASGSSGIFTIHPKESPDPFQVYCKQQTSNTRTYILDRKNNAQDFNQSFAQYQAGFGTLSSKNYFIGLDKVSMLSRSKTFELRISAKLVNGSLFFMQYQNWWVSDAADGYRLHFNQTTNDTYLLGDCFSPLHGAAFSAWDQDQDEEAGVHCAGRHGGGWWFRGASCSTCNPTGPIVTPLSTAPEQRTGIDAELFWTESQGDLALTKISMFLVVHSPE